MKKLLIAAILGAFLSIPTASNAVNYVLPLQGGTSTQYIDIDSIHVNRDYGDWRKLMVTLKVNAPEYSSPAEIVYTFSYNLNTNEMYQTPFTLTMEGKRPYMYHDDAKKIDVVGSINYIYANYAYYKAFGTYFSKDMIDKYGTTDMAK